MIRSGTIPQPHSHPSYHPIPTPPNKMLGLHPKPATSCTPSPASAASQPLPSPMVRVILDSYDAHAETWAGSSDALTDWLNARWQKSGYSVSKETVCFTLRVNGRDAKMGMGDQLRGAFYRDL